MSIFTGGIWFLFVWLPVLASGAAASYRCTRCGSTAEIAPTSMGRSLTGAEHDD